MKKSQNKAHSSLLPPALHRAPTEATPAASKVILSRIGSDPGRRDDRLDPLLYLGARKQHTPATRQAPEANVRSKACDLPFETTAGVLLAKTNDVSDPQFHRHIQSPLAVIKADPSLSESRLALHQTLLERQTTYSHPNHRQNAPSFADLVPKPASPPS